MFSSKGILKAQIWMLIATPLLIALFSCSRQPSSERQALTFDSLSYQCKTSISAMEGRERPALDVKISIQQAVTSADDERPSLANHFISDMMEQFGGANEQSIGDNMNIIVSRHADLYRKWVHENLNNYEDLEAASHWLSSEFDLDGRAVFNRDGFLSYCFSKFEFNGGPHGEMDFYFATCTLNSFDEEELYGYHPISLLDVIDADSVKLLQPLFESRVAKHFELESVEELFKQGYLFEKAELLPTDNFYLTETGITWVYNVYEVAPYAAGTIEVPVTWEELKPYLPAESPLQFFVNTSASAQ